MEGTYAPASRILRKTLSGKINCKFSKKFDTATVTYLGQVVGH